MPTIISPSEYHHSSNNTTKVCMACSSVLNDLPQHPIDSGQVDQQTLQDCSKYGPRPVVALSKLINVPLTLNEDDR